MEPTQERFFQAVTTWHLAEGIRANRSALFRALFGCLQGSRAGVGRVGEEGRAIRANQSLLTGLDTACVSQIRSRPTPSWLFALCSLAQAADVSRTSGFCGYLRETGWLPSLRKNKAAPGKSCPLSLLPVGLLLPEFAVAADWALYSLDLNSSS